MGATAITARPFMSNAGHAKTVTPLLIAAVVLLGAVGPLATDMYVPAFPHVTADLGASIGSVQLTLTTFFLGMGLGQLIGGPVSDQIGRKRPLLVGTVVTLVASVICAMAPTIAIMLVARFFQGLGAGWAMVIGRAVIVDLAHGSQLVRVMNVLMGVGALAPMIAPLIGAFILRFSVWRNAFWLIAVLTIVMFLAALLVIPESLPPAKRHGGGLQAFVRNSRVVLANRRFVGYMLTNAATGVALFAYVASSPILIQVRNGLSPMTYSVDFAANAGGMMIMTLLAARLATRVNTRKVMFTGQSMALVGSLIMMTGAVWFNAHWTFLLPSFFLLMAGQGLIGPNGGALASAEVPQYAGTASAVLGLTMSLSFSISPPIVALFGEGSAFGPALMFLLGALASMFFLLVVARAKAGAGL
ncbi:multidrug effflux MFS transporter [Aestuariimicrobium sp. T2.26MG-19.2B]|uniref:multidrug effflux MFS transporter n=1 Tax=Aestuariimicrobium sp. T2.26MG-19.2B TaxID=3040679 RepID=UPI002477A500|nr:multidrug effflux MFS transporter [Aestuariimicrobium sp. T2.26MG-19.2B]CAI9406913.1 Bicyclomycin resistance protein [Aestuariimicrobium sp. T2.26MG-19.2B]